MTDNSDEDKPCGGPSDKGCKHNGVRRKNESGKLLKLCDGCARKRSEFTATAKKRKAPMPNTETSSSAAPAGPLTADAVERDPTPQFINVAFLKVIREVCNKNDEARAIVEYIDELFQRLKIDGRSSFSILWNREEILKYHEMIEKFMTLKYERRLDDPEKLGEAFVAAVKNKDPNPSTGPVNLELAAFRDYAEREGHVDRCSREIFNHQRWSIPSQLHVQENEALDLSQLPSNLLCPKPKLVAQDKEWLEKNYDRFERAKTNLPKQDHHYTKEHTVIFGQRYAHAYNTWTAPSSAALDAGASIEDQEMADALDRSRVPQGTEPENTDEVETSSLSAAQDQMVETAVDVETEPNPTQMEDIVHTGQPATGMSIEEDFALIDIPMGKLAEYKKEMALKWANNQ